MERIPKTLLTQIDLPVTNRLVLFRSTVERNKRNS